METNNLPKPKTNKEFLLKLSEIRNANISPKSISPSDRGIMKLERKIKKIDMKQEYQKRQNDLYKQIINECNDKLGTLKSSKWLPEGIKVSEIKEYNDNFIIKFSEMKTEHNKKMGIILVDPKEAKNYLNKFKMLYRELSKQYGCKIKFTEYHCVAVI